MEQIQPYLDQFVELIREGFQQVNAVQGLIIALIAALLMSAYTRIVIVAFAATVIHLIADVMLPVVANGAAFRLPPLLEANYWRYALVVYLGYFVVITIFYILRRVLLRR